MCESVHITVDDESGEAIPMKSLVLSNDRGLELQDGDDTSPLVSPQRRGQKQTFSRPVQNLLNVSGWPSSTD